MKQIENLRATLATMTPGDKLEISHRGRSVNAVRNAACLVGQEKRLVFSVNVNWEAGTSTITCVRNR